MLKFFKALWRKLITEGQLKNRVINVIGEILLLVVGILIAVQIDNWNEIVTDRARRGQYIGEIKENLKTDIGHLNDIVELNANIIEKVDSVFYILQHTKIEDKAFLKIMDYESVIISQHDFHPEKAGYNSLISSIDPDLLQDHELVQKIADHYGYIEQQSGLTRQILSNTEVNWLDPAFVSLYTKKEFLSALGYHLATPAITAAHLSQNEILIGALIKKKRHTKTAISEAEDFKEKTELLIEEIDKTIQ